jgi:D-alanyl-D-alanine carboxypeptidase (penicillin-binding protein 5/6)
MRAAFARDEILKTVTKKEYYFRAKTGLNHAVKSTDELLGSFLTSPPYAFLGGKTGYLQEAGYCFAATAENADSDRVIAVVLGAPSKEHRFREVKTLIFWAFDAYQWPLSLSKR